MLSRSTDILFILYGGFIAVLVIFKLIPKPIKHG